MPQTAQEVNEVFEVASLIKGSIAHSWNHTTIIADDSYEINGRMINNFNRRTWAVALAPRLYLTIKHGLTVTWKSRLKYADKKWYETVLMTGSPSFEMISSMRRAHFVQLRQRLLNLQAEFVDFRTRMEAAGEVGFGRASDLVR